MLVNERYVNVVDIFVFPTIEEGTPSFLPERDLNLLTQEIARKIIVASDLRPRFDAQSGRKVSLREAVYFCVQDRDIKFNQDTPLAIEGEGSHERSKEILGRVVKQLSVDFIQVNPDDLKAVALLFGVHRICDLAMGRITEMPEPELYTESMVKALDRLIEFRNKYPRDLSTVINPVTRDFLDKMDAQIAETTHQLAERVLNHS